MITLQLLVVSFPIYLHVCSVPACALRYTNKPIIGLRCATTITTAVVQAAHPQCVWRCLRAHSCRYINHDSVTDQCDVGLGQCESLQRATGAMVQAFGPPRRGCLRWGSKQEPGWVPVVGKNGDNYVARTVSGDVSLIGTYDTYSSAFWANNAGMAVGPVKQTDQDIEFLTKDPACPLPWMSYTAGEPLPSGAVIGGRLVDGSATYVAKVYDEAFIARVR